MRLMISEVLEQAAGKKTKQEKIEFLRQNYSKAMHFILEHAYNPNIKFLLPPGKPPFTPMPTNEGQGMLFTEARKLYLFVEGGHPTLKQTRREMLFINMLESLDPKDADLMVSVKDKKIPYKGITKDLIKEAFGDYNG